MELKSATLSLSALGHEGRLEIFRLLVSAGPEGLAAGEIARRLGMVPNSLSANLNILSQANLTTSRRKGRSIIYQADFSTMTTLVGFLVADCCGGAAEICSPLNQLLSQAQQCAPTPLRQKEVC